MITVIRKTNFIEMPWKNGKGITTQILIEPENAKLEKNDFYFRLSSAPIMQDTSFSLFTKKVRLLTPIKGAGFILNNDEYEKFEVAHFSGEEKTDCRLLKGPVVDFGVIYDPEKVKVQSKILNLKSGITFSLEEKNSYFVTVLSGELSHTEQTLSELETLHYKEEIKCELQIRKAAVLFFLTVSYLNQ